MLDPSRYLIHFARATVDRGCAYFDDGHVRSLRASSTHAEAEVWGSGSSVYRVRVQLLARGRARKLCVDCTCPPAERGAYCKHLLATLLELGDRAPHFDVPGSQPITLTQQGPAQPWDPGPLAEVDVNEDWGDEGWQGDAEGLSPPFALQSRNDRSPVGSFHAADQRWREQLDDISRGSRLDPTPVDRPTPQPEAGESEIYYVVDLESCALSGEIVIEFRRRLRSESGEWGKLRLLSLTEAEASRLVDPLDRELLGLLLSLPPGTSTGQLVQYTANPSSFHWSSRSRAVHPVAYFELLLPRLANTGRLLLGHLESQPRGPLDWTPGTGACVPVSWDEGPAWRFRLLLERRPEGGISLVGELERAGERRPLDAAVTLLRRGFVVFPDRIARCSCGEAFEWVVELRRSGGIDVPAERTDELIAHLAASPNLPELHGIEVLGWRNTEAEPSPWLRLELPEPEDRGGRSRGGAILGEVGFDYRVSSDSETLLSVALSDPGSAVSDGRARRLVRRDRECEASHYRQLLEIGAVGRPDSSATGYPQPSYLEDGAIALVELPKSEFTRIAEALLDSGWKVEADGAPLRRARGMSFSVSSGIDWFELEGEFEFDDGLGIGLPQLLAAAASGERRVLLGDGSHGLLPERWLERVAPLAQLGEPGGETLRFAPGQATLLDVLLAARESEGDAVRVDAQFARIRERLRGRHRVEARSAPRGFKGELREYQREGLGWLHFLRELGLGGCLADDMGLGKTVQVLALLESRRTRRLAAGETRVPSIVVVPSSVVHNWLREAERFTPRLRVVDYTGQARATLLSGFEHVDLVVTSYGTLRRDIAKLVDQRFDYALLDEAQTIKNASSQIAKAVRLLRAEHRLVLTGTPVENHLGELLSLFEFLNPGLLGRSARLRKLARSKKAEDEATLVALAHALEPLILRRTKAAVLDDLPPKTEQTLYCELKSSQRRHYDELRSHYRGLLLERTRERGMARSKIEVLEALLRLRQAACHPGLIDPDQRDRGSAKLDLLLEQLEEVIDEGHKVLVYSQFTQLLSIVLDRLQEREIVCEYLDGRTRDRERRVDRFQQDPDCSVFLVSLKAGGVGLNLTAADYVFVLDPWWNPAAEAQAIDRAHRIGQKRPVFAYRIIARDTVEEKILELQGRKRALADAIVAADGGVLRDLSFEDLAGLLS